jgi:hypothetical protein
MTPAQARLVDPVLTDRIRGYRNAQMVGYALFPRIGNNARGAKIPTFDKDRFRLLAAERAPGATTARVNVSYSPTDFSSRQYALEGVVPRESLEEASNGPGIDLGLEAVATVRDILALLVEKDQADLATNASNYATTNKATLSGTSQWSDYVNSNPIKAISEYKEAIRTQCGIYPNTLILGAAVYAQLQNHPVITDRIKHTSREIATEPILAGLFDLQAVHVGRAVYQTNAGVQTDVWGKSAVLAYVAPPDWRNRHEPSYGYTYALRGYPMVEQAYFDAPHKSWIYPTTDEARPYIVGADAGFLVSAAVA